MRFGDGDEESFQSLPQKWEDEELEVKKEKKPEKSKANLKQDPTKENPKKSKAKNVEGETKTNRFAEENKSALKILDEVVKENKEVQDRKQREEYDRLNTETKREIRREEKKVMKKKQKEIIMKYVGWEKPEAELDPARKGRKGHQGAPPNLDMMKDQDDKEERPREKKKVKFNIPKRG